MIRALIRPWRVWLAVIALSFLLAQTLDVVPPLIVQRLIDTHLTTGATEGLLTLAALYYGATVAVGSVNALGIYLTSVVAQGALHDLRVRLFAHLQQLPISYFDQTPIGEIISRGTADVETVDTLFTSGVAILVSSLLSLLTTAAAMLVLSAPLSFVTALIAPLLVVITQFFRVRVRAAERDNRIATGLMNTALQETLNGVEVIRAFRREDVFSTRFRQSLRLVVGAANRSTVYNSFYPPLMATLSALIVALLLWLGASGVTAAWHISLGVLTAFVLLFRRFFGVIIDLGDEWQTVQSALSGLERIRQVLALPVENVALHGASTMSSTAEPAENAEQSKEESRAHGIMSLSKGAPSAVSFEQFPPEFLPAEDAILLRDVVFGYREGLAVLHRLSFSARAGEHIALVGRTGAGKSSALHLLAGLYEPWAGAIRVAGRDPRALSADERRRVVGVVPQAVQLFSETVFENLTLGDASVPREAVERASLIAGADGFIRALPLGYDTPLSGAGRGGGAQLSAGQRQLLALARALVWDPAVLLLDEATAAVDNASDAAFRAALRADVASHRRAVLTVAHRLSTAREADRVLVMEAGRLVEEGAPADLIARGGRFAALVELEAAGWDWQSGDGITG